MDDSKEIGFVKLMRTDEANELMLDGPAFILLSKIALRARRTDKNSLIKLDIGEALIGDFKSYGLTRQQYRSAVERLKSNRLITTKTTNRGTIAKILDVRVYDINKEESNQPTNPGATIKQPTANHQATTKKNVKKDKNEKKKKKIAFSLESKLFSNITDSDISDWMKAYPALDIPLAILQAAQWLLANPTKLKDNYRRFLTNWFKREQERGGNKTGGSQAKTKLFPIAGKICSGSNCSMPAIYQSTGGAYDHYWCYDHMPAKVKLRYAM